MKGHEHLHHINLEVVLQSFPLWVLMTYRAASASSVIHPKVTSSPSTPPDPSEEMAAEVATQTVEPGGAGLYASLY